MDFLQDFLKINQNEGKTFEEFIAEYDLKNQTTFSLTLNYENAMANILKKTLRNFLTQVQIPNDIGMKKKIFTVLELYFEYLKQNDIDIATFRIMRFLRETKYYSDYIWHFSDVVWKYFDVYDEDANSITRRMRLCYILNEVHRHYIAE